MPSAPSSSASRLGSIPQSVARSSTNGMPVASDARRRSAGVGFAREGRVGSSERRDVPGIAAHRGTQCAHREAGARQHVAQLDPELVVGRLHHLLQSQTVRASHPFFMVAGSIIL